MSCCEGGGEKRFSNSDFVSDQASICETNNTSRNSMCSDVSVDGSSIGTSLVAGVDTSPPASLHVSDSPFDSPLHKLHQNTPDDSASVASSSVTSPLKRPFSPSTFPYFRNLEAAGKVQSPRGSTLPPDLSNYDSGNNKKTKEKSSTKKKGKKSFGKSGTDSNLLSSSIPESTSTGLQIANWFFKRSNKSSKDKDHQKITSRSPPDTFSSSLCEADDPLVNVSFKFQEEMVDSESESNNETLISTPASHTDRSSLGFEPHREMLMTTPRSEGSTDSDQVIDIINQEPPFNLIEDSPLDKKLRRKNNLDNYTDELMNMMVIPSLSAAGPSRSSLQSSITPTSSTPLLSRDDSQSLDTVTAISPPPLQPFYNSQPPSDIKKHPTSSAASPLSTSTPIHQQLVSPSPRIPHSYDSEAILPKIDSSLPFGNVQGKDSFLSDQPPYCNPSKDIALDKNKQPSPRPKFGPSSSINTKESSLPVAKPSASLSYLQDLIDSLNPNLEENRSSSQPAKPDRNSSAHKKDSIAAMEPFDESNQSPRASKTSVPNKEILCQQRERKETPKNVSHGELNPEKLLAVESNSTECPIDDTVESGHHDINVQSIKDHIVQSTHDEPVKPVLDDTCKSTLDVGKSTLDVGKSTHDVGKSTHDVGKSTHDVGKSTHDVGKSTLDNTGKSTHDETGKSSLDDTSKSSFDDTVKSAHDVSVDSLSSRETCV